MSGQAQTSAVPGLVVAWRARGASGYRWRLEHVSGLVVAVGEYRADVLAAAELLADLTDWTATVTGLLDIEGLGERVAERLQVSPVVMPGRPAGTAAAR